MVKKKTKATSNRGFATTSLPSKKKEIKEVEEEKAVEEKKKEPALKVESKIDEALALVQKYHSLNDYKAEAMAEQLSKEDACSSKVKKTRFFRMSSDLENDLIAVIKQSRSSLLETRLVSKESEVEKSVAHLDLLYRVLIKLGFSDQDVLASLRTTLSKSLEEHLDWLCIHVPYDRMPIGFFDKYYNEKDENNQITLFPNSKPQKGIKKTQESEELTPFQKKEAEDQIEAIKMHILKAAENYMCDENTETVNERHASLRIRVQELETKLLSLEKTEISHQVTMQISKEIKCSKDTIKSLEGDWEFSKKSAQELYICKLKEIAETQQKKNREDAKKKKEEQLQEQNKKTVKETKEGLSDDDEALFEGLMIAEDELYAKTIPSSTVVRWTFIDLSKSKLWKGKHPKDILFDYCKKQNKGKQTFFSKEVSPGIWQSSLSLGELSFELPAGLAVESDLSAKNLIAAYSLFQLDPNSSVYQLMHTDYRKLWAEWAEERSLKIDGPRIENDKKRLAMFKELTNKSYEDYKNKKNSNDTPNKAVDQKEEKHKNTKTNQKQDAKKTAVFNASQKMFTRRLNTKDYVDMKAKRDGLPVAAYRQEILGLVKSNQILIISGETGCGKSTQVPQFLAEDLLLNTTNKKGLVICTQPRRISAMSIASRVSLEMGDTPKSVGSKGSLVGYQIRLESKFFEGNVLMYCTTGILLQRLQSDLELKDVTHVIIDEVHERTIESDFLLIMLRKICEIRPDLKVILMSATIEAQRFSAYFDHCPVISVPGRTYPVQVQFLEDVVEKTGYILEEDSKFAVKKYRTKKDEGDLVVSGQNGSQRQVHYEMFQDSDEEDYDFTKTYSKLSIQGKEMDSKGYSKRTHKMIRRMDDRKVNYDLILELLEYICKPHADIPATGAILLFLPGMNEIRSLYDLASSHSQFGTDKFLLIPLHSTLSSDHQEKAFEVPPVGIRKIVFSTNIAETGVTISDVTVVIDTGMSRSISYDDKRKVSRLLQKYVAKSNARQRRGRAGRVQEGICFHLFTQERFEQMSDYETPEILRLPLEELCLRIKVYKLGSIVDILSSAIDAPSHKSIENAIQSLQGIHALTMNETLTPLGTHLVNLPVDMHIGKMILFGAIFKCLDPVLTIAACLSFKGPFVRPFGKEFEADMARSQFQCGDSDFLTLYIAYNAWREKLISVRGKPGSTRQIQEFCKENFLSQKNLETIEEMKCQFLSLLINIGFVKTDKLDISINRYDIKKTVRLCDVPSAYDKHKESLAVVNAALSAGLYPKIAEYVSETDTMANKMMDLKLHPSSMLFRRQKDIVHELYVYNTLVMNSNDYQNDKAVIWEAASISPAVVMLLATDLEIKHKQRRLNIDGWLTFDCFARTSVILKFFRAELNNWFSEKMKNPTIDLTAYNQNILDALVKMLESFDY